MFRPSCKKLLAQFVTIVCVISCAHGKANTQDTARGQEIGGTIGTAFKTALNIALPGVPDIIAAIWPNKSDKKKGTDADVTNALNEQQKKIKDQINQHVQVVQAVVDELRLVDVFTVNASKAHPYLLHAYGLLSAAPPNDKLWRDVSQDLKKANIFLNRIAQIRPEDIRAKVKDTTEKEALLAFLDNLEVSQSDITAHLDAKNGDAMIVSLQQVSTALDGLRLMGAARLDSLTDDLAAVRNVFGSPISPPPVPPLSLGEPAPPLAVENVEGDDIQKLIKERITKSKKQQ